MKKQANSRWTREGGEDEEAGFNEELVSKDTKADGEGVFSRVPKPGGQRQAQKLRGAGRRWSAVVLAEA
jgi:hypothetical protein